MKISRAGLGTGKCRNSGKAGHNKRMCQGSSKTVRQSNATEEPNVSPQAEVEMPTHNTQVYDHLYSFAVLQLFGQKRESLCCFKI